MTESESFEPSTDAESSGLSIAVGAALTQRAFDGLTLQQSVADYVTARKARGARPEEVVIEVKSLVSRATRLESPSSARLDDAAEDIVERIVRMAIEAYFPD